MKLSSSVRKEACHKLPLIYSILMILTLVYRASCKFAKHAKKTGEDSKDSLMGR